MSTYGFSEADARRVLEREIAKTAASTSFYWESDELEDLLDIVVDAVAKLVAQNNARFVRDMERELRRSRLS